MLQSVIKRAALGRTAKIGALYDVRTEQFLHDSLFSTKLDEGLVETMDLGDSTFKLVKSDSIQDKFSELGIEAELKISLLANMIEVCGSGAYLKEEKKSARAQSLSLVYKILTVNEELTLRYCRDKIDLEVLKDCNNLQATHVVVGINWGAVCFITCQCENSDGIDETVMKLALKVHLDKLHSDIQAGAPDYKDTEKKKLEKFSFTCTSDVSMKDKDLPTTFEGVLEFAQSFPSIVRQSNDGKGVPVLYMLLPLEAVKNICRIKITLELHYASVKEDSIIRGAQIIEDVINKRQRLFDIHKDLHAFGEYVTESSLSAIDKYMKAIIVDESAFKLRLQELVTKIRRQKADFSSLDQLLIESVDESSPFAKYEEHIRELQGDVNTVNTIKAKQKRGIIYLGKKHEFITDDSKIIYVFYKPNSNADRTRTHRNEEFFLRYQKTCSRQPGIIFKVVDENIRPDLWDNRESKAIIEEFKNGRKTCDDFYEKESQSAKMCLVKHDSTRNCNYKPSETAVVKIRCPNSVSGTEECSGVHITWNCAKCKEQVEYGLKTWLFYCKCGESAPFESLFRCCEDTHGIDFISYPPAILVDELGALRATQEKNILILGETGVGKSTWINGIVNYMSFADFNEAREADSIPALIPSQFTFTEKGKSANIKIGKPSENEVLQTGQSATQKTRSYIFHVGDVKLRLIDTPGIGDSRGIEQDRKNFDNILAYLSHYEEIHAVCILLRPNNSRLTVVFRFCIQELLAHLHTSAKKNIVFCFTNARATFYRPGDTLPVLNKMLKDKNIGITANPNNYFCFDNEPFRFLACLHNKVQFNDEDIQANSVSWDRAVEETNNLFVHINKIPPHKIRNTICMNEARRVIVAMGKPMAEVARTIQENVQTADAVMKEIYHDARGVNDLEKNLRFTGTDLIRRELSCPRTVCAHPDCIDHINVGEGNTQKVIYKQVCDENCYVPGIPSETQKDFRLILCICISFLTRECKICKHHYSFHMHQTYTLETVKKEFISEEVQMKIMAKKTEKEKKEAFKTEIDRKLDELKYEQKKILEVSATYGGFLEKNALLAYNDAVGDYLDMVIKQQEGIPERQRKSDLLQQMRNLLAEYISEKEIIDKAMKSGTTTTPKQI